LDGCADVADEAVHVVLAGFAVEPTGFAVAGVIDDVADDALHEVLAVDED
jgi:hypothetical protein